MELREALETAFANTEKPEQVENAQIPAEKVEIEKPPEEKAEKPRDLTGKFTKAEAVQDVEPKPVLEQPKPVRKAPSSWKPDAQAAWAKADRGEPLTPEEIKVLVGEAERREGDYHKGITQYKTAADRAAAFDRILTPYQQTLQSLGVDGPTAVQKLLQADHTLRTADAATKSAFMQQLAQQYGVDLGMQIDPNMQMLLSELNNLRLQQQTWQNSIQATQSEQAEQTLAEFLSVERPHFEAVREDMAVLMQTGKAKTLEQAYEMAGWMRPEVRQTLIERERAESQRQAEESIRQKKAQTAALSVKGSSPAGGVQPIKGGSIREILESQFANT